MSISSLRESKRDQNLLCTKWDFVCNLNAVIDRLFRFWPSRLIHTSQPPSRLLVNQRKTLLTLLCLYSAMGLRAVTYEWLVHSKLTVWITWPLLLFVCACHINEIGLNRHAILPNYSPTWFDVFPAVSVLIGFTKGLRISWIRYEF